MTHCKNSDCHKAGEEVDTNFCINCGEKIRPYQSTNKNYSNKKPVKNITIIKTGKIAHQPDSYNQWLTPKIGLKMQYIPIGRYWMGSPDNCKDGQSTERPQHFVSVKNFYISSNPISQLQYKTLTGLNPSVSQSYTHPVESVSYFEASEFCRVLSEQVERKYRLPTEAEWEYACRSTTTGLFNFGDAMNSEHFHCRSLVENNIATMPSSIESYPPNQFGLFDMHGNVWEWCQDRWHDSYKNAPHDGSAWMCEEDSNSRVIRGGSWRDYETSCRSASRDFLDQTTRLCDVGFRVVCEI